MVDIKSKEKIKQIIEAELQENLHILLDPKQKIVLVNPE